MVSRRTRLTGSLQLGPFSSLLMTGALRCEEWESSPSEQPAIGVPTGGYANRRPRVNREQETSGRPCSGGRGAPPSSRPGPRNPLPRGRLAGVLLVDPSLEASADRQAI